MMKEVIYTKEEVIQIKTVKCHGARQQMNRGLTCILIYYTYLVVAQYTIIDGII